MTAQLAPDGWQVNHKRVLRIHTLVDVIMQQESLLCHLKRRWVQTTDPVQCRTDDRQQPRVEGVSEPASRQKSRQKSR